MKKIEAMKAMLEGKKFVYDKEYMMYFDGDEFVVYTPSCRRKEPINMFWNYVDKWEEVPPWYENIDRPVLCWTWDNYLANKSLSFIIGYDKDNVVHKYEGKYHYYKNAEPVKKGELDCYII